MAAQTGTYLAAATTDGRLVLALRRPDGSWRGFEDLSSKVGNRGIVQALGMGGWTTSLDGRFFNVQVAAVTADGSVWHARYDSGDVWTQLDNVEAVAGERGQFTSVSCLGTTAFPEGPGTFDQLHLSAATADGRLWQTFRRQDGAWTPFQDDEARYGEIGDVRQADLAFSAFGQSTTIARNLVAVSTDGRLWHGRELRAFNGSLQLSPFVDIESRAGESGTIVSASCAAPGTEQFLHVCAVGSNGSIWHTLRGADFPFFPLAGIGIWTPLTSIEGPAGERGSFTSVTCRQGTAGLHVCGITADGRLWHTIRQGNGAWTPFSDVETVAGEVGQIADVALVAD